MAAELAVADAAPRRTTKVLALVGTGHFFAHFYVIVLPPLFPLLREELAVSYAALGLLLTMPSLATMVLQTPVGFLVDRFGARWPLVLGLGIMSAAVAAAGFFATGYWVLFVLMILMGVGNSVFHPADYAILAARIEHRRLGRAFSLHTFAGHLGWAVAPGTVVFLTALWSWQAALAIVGLCGLVVTLIMAVHGRELDAAAADTDPGAPPREAAPKEAATKGAAQGPEAPPGRAGFALLFSAPMLLFFLYMVMAAVATGGLNGFTVTALVNLHGVGLTAANAALTALLITSALGVLLGGWLADQRAGRASGRLARRPHAAPRPGPGDWFLSRGHGPGAHRTAVPADRGRRRRHGAGRPGAGRDPALARHDGEQHRPGRRGRHGLRLGDHGHVRGRRAGAGVLRLADRSEPGEMGLHPGRARHAAGARRRPARQPAGAAGTRRRPRTRPKTMRSSP